jgi:hypothetical protein
VQQQFGRGREYAGPLKLPDFAAEGRDFLMHARIGMLRALKRQLAAD